jgi:hypothetical protein
VLAVVNRDRQADEVRHDGRTTGPGLDWLLVLGRLRSFDLFHQVGVTERPFFNERVMIYPYFLPRRETIIEVVRLLRRVFLPLVCWPHGETG